MQISKTIAVSSINFNKIFKYSTEPSGSVFCLKKNLFAPFEKYYSQRLSNKNVILVERNNIRNMEEKIINKVSESGLLTINLEDYYPKEEIVLFDLKNYLFMELILKEKDFREALKNLDLVPYENKLIAVTCSADAVIPMWAYMLVASYLQPVAKDIFFGTVEEMKEKLLLTNISKINTSEFTDQRIVIKGCGDLPIGESAYLTATKILRPIAKSIMYGEPCSTVPIYKKK